MSLCIICGKGEAEVPDRDSGSSRNKLCVECHAKRLRGDMGHILRVEQKRRQERNG